MLRSIKSQIILALSVIILFVLGASAYFVIDQQRRQLNQAIFQNALAFAQLTHNQVINSFDQNHQQGAFSTFQRDLANTYRLNPDITSLSIYNYQSELLFEDESRMQNPLQSDFLSQGTEQLLLLGEEKADTSLAKAEPELQRIQSLFPSVLTAQGRVIYLEDDATGQTRSTTFDGQLIPPVSETDQILNIVYPFRDPNDITRSYAVLYTVSYQALNERVEQMILRLGAIGILGIVVALLIGLILAQRITSPLKKLSRGAAKIGKGDLETRIPIQSKSEVGKLATVFNQMAADLQISTKAMIEQEKTAKELELAVEIQQELLPSTLPKVNGLDIAASLTAATQVGGDGYDFIPIQQKNGELLFYIADVTGHGVGAGLVSAINNALIPALIEHCHDTQSLVVELNKLLKLKTSSSIFVTLIMALWDAKTSTVQFTQAGHNPIVHYRAQAKKAVKLAHGGVALGMIENVSKVIKTEAVSLLQNDLFILYTDGITEARNTKNEIYGLKRLMKSVEKHANLDTAQTIHDAILKDLHHFMGGHPQEDDVTLMVVKRRG